MEEKRIEVTENEELLKEEVDIYELPAAISFVRNVKMIASVAERF